MRLLAILPLAVLPPSVFAQPAASTPPCASAEGRQLQKLLREKGVDALVEEVLRPQREVWQRIKNGLLRRDGWTYFMQGVRSALLPEMNGTVISHTGLELVVGILDPAKPEVMLRLDSPLPKEIEPGAKVLFVGIASDFQPHPFMFVIDVQHSNLAVLRPRSGP